MATEALELPLEDSKPRQTEKMMSHRPKRPRVAGEQFARKTKKTKIQRHLIIQRVDSSERIFL